MLKNALFGTAPTTLTRAAGAVQLTVAPFSMDWGDVNP